MEWRRRNGEGSGRVGRVRGEGVKSDAIEWRRKNGQGYGGLGEWAGVEGEAKSGQVNGSGRMGRGYD